MLQEECEADEDCVQSRTCWDIPLEDAPVINGVNVSEVLHHPNMGPCILKQWVLRTDRDIVVTETHSVETVINLFARCNVLTSTHDMSPPQCGNVNILFVCYRIGVAQSVEHLSYHMLWVSGTCNL